MSSADKTDLLVASMQLVTAYLSNPNTNVPPADIPALIASVHGAAVRMASGEENVEERPAEILAMPPEVKATLEGSSVATSAPLPRRGASLDHGVWKGVPAETRGKFKRLIERYNIPIGLDGYPVPRAKPENFISEDGSQVVDPIDGMYYTMLKRHIRLDYDLSHEELLQMYGLTKEQLPKAGPRYSEAKAAQARRAGLGRQQRKDDQAAA